LSKPQKQKSSGVVCLIDGVIAKRVQTLGSSVDITREQAQELANSGVVEYVADSPSVSIQIDTNDVGSTDTMALLTDQMITYTEEVSTDEPRGGIFRAYIKADSSNSATITEQDMLTGYCSILATLDEDGTTAKRTLWMNNCAVTGVNLSYDVGGNATENYTLAADNKTWFLNDLAGVRCYKPLIYQITKTSSGLAFQAMASCVPEGASVVAMGINNNILRERTMGGVTGNATFEVPTASGFLATSVALDTPWVSTASDSTDRVWIIYKSTAVGALTWEAQDQDNAFGFELESSAGAFGAVRRGHVKAYLWNTGTDSEGTSTAAGQALRLQTVSIDVALGEEQLYELGTHGFYGISKNTPVPITVTVSALDSDLEYFAMLTSTAFGNTTDVQTVTLDDFNGYNSLKILVYRDIAQTSLLKTIDVGNMYVQSENFNISVGDNATNEITFTTDNITVIGSGTSVVGGPNWV